MAAKCRKIGLLASILIALDDVGLAVPLQEALEGGGHSVMLDAALASGPDGPRAAIADVVLLAADARIAELAERWRDLDPPPALLAVGSDDRERPAANEARVTFISTETQKYALLNSVDAALKTRFSGRLSMAYARGALGLKSSGDDRADAGRVIVASRNADEEIVRETLRWFANHYVTATDRVAALREDRILIVPEVDLCRALDGTKTIRTLVRGAGLSGIEAGRLLWALASVGAIVLSEAPPDLATTDRRAVAAARRHLRARCARLEQATHYDVLEVTRDARIEDLDHAARMLLLRYSPDRLAKLDLGEVTPLVESVWEQIRVAHATLKDPSQRQRYDHALDRAGNIRSTWATGSYDRETSEEAFLSAQRALVSGEPFKAVSALAKAARTHPDHPDYEATLAWARYRAALARGEDREEAATRERGIAELALLGRRPRPRALLALGLLCAADGDSGAARWALNEALACDPNLPAAKQLLKRLNKQA